jgi:two-component system, sensor histidine kinase and response regulator
VSPVPASVGRGSVRRREPSISSHSRIYILTGDEAALTRSKEALHRIPEQLNEIAGLTSDNPNQQQRIAELRPAIESVIAFLNQSTEARRSSGFDSARQVLAGGAGKTSMARTRTILDQMRLEERRLLERRDNADAHRMGNMVSTVVATFIGQIILLAFLYWLTHVDIRERHRTEAALRQSTTDLKEARDAALSAAKMKSQFLANMSHEIRTPMNGVLGMTEILLDTPLTPRQREFAETIQSSANTLLAIINDILDFSKIEEGMVRFENIPFNLRMTIESVVDLFAQASLRYRRRHLAGRSAAFVYTVHTGRRIDHSPVFRHRIGAGDFQTTGSRNGR